MPQLDQAEIVKGIEIVFKEANSLFASNNEWGTRPGAFLCIADGKTGTPLFAPTAIGRPPEEKIEKYETFCQEKARRLAEHPEHLSSWESRNPDENRYSGAVRINELIFSLSGLPELGDEAVMLIAGGSYFIQVPGIWDTIQAIADRSNNPYWDRLVGFMSRHT